MQQYLETSEYINWTSPEIKVLAAQLRGGLKIDSDISKNCFEYVRDKIKHTGDYQINQITCKASDVLIHETGYCYAKSHLLAALLRANGIPAGLCYQRLSLEGGGAPYSLHGFNAVYLQELGWYRLDPRGNKDGVDAQFSPPIEQLAFRIEEPLETDIQGIWPEPMPTVVNILLKYQTCRDVYKHLPDIEVYTASSDT